MLREKPRGPEIHQHPLWAIDNRHQLGDVREVRYPHNWFAYIKMLHESSTRLLTHDADILRSAIGILNVMSLFREEKWICGMPSTMLDWALLWQPTGPLRSRGEARSGHSFPSWSWIGWVGPITLPESPGPVATSIEITDWSFSTPEHTIENPKAARAASRLFRLFSSKKSATGSKGVASNTTAPRFKGEMVQYSPWVASKDPIWTPTVWRHKDRTDLIAYEVGVNSRSPPELQRALQQQALIDAAEPLIEAGILTFTTSSAMFQIQLEDRGRTYRGHDPEKTRSCKVFYKGAWVGTVLLERTWAANWELFASLNAEFIVISGAYASFDGGVMDAPDQGQYTYDVDRFERLVQSMHKRLLFNVMWVKLQGSMVVRVAIGQIHRDAFQQANPVRKTVNLG